MVKQTGRSTILYAQEVVWQTPQRLSINAGTDAQGSTVSTCIAKTKQAAGAEVNKKGRRPRWSTPLALAAFDFSISRSGGSQTASIG
jgi:hypothetical protein